MARFLVVGSLGWDRVIWLEKGLEPGGRLPARSEIGAGQDLIGGRLGGGAANASAALISAGHTATVFSGVPNDPVGDRVLQHASAVGIEVQLVRKVSAPRHLSLILIEPGGERTILGVSSQEEDIRAAWRRALSECAPISQHEVQTIAPDGIYLRAPFPGFNNVELCEEAKVIAHWPFGGLETAVGADLLIGSGDDLYALAPQHNLFELAKRVAGERLKALIVTRGAEGGTVFTEETQFKYQARPTQQKDATGAGDSFAAGVLEALVSGADLQEAVVHGANWGGIAAAEIGPLSTYRPGLFSSWR